jgi:hypothetical protein
MCVGLLSCSIAVRIELSARHERHVRLNVRVSKGRDVRSIRSQRNEGETAGMKLGLNNAEFDATIELFPSGSNARNSNRVRPGRSLFAVVASARETLV